MTQEEIKNRIVQGFEIETPAQRLEFYRFLLDVYLTSKEIYRRSVSEFHRDNTLIGRITGRGICHGVDVCSSLSKESIEIDNELPELNKAINKELKKVGRAIWIAPSGLLQPRIDLLTNLIKSMEQ